MKRVFMTGITGLLGTNLANELLLQNYQITAVARDPDKYIGNRNSNLKLIKSNLHADHTEYLENIEIVIHIAAETATNLIRYSDYEKINYGSTVLLYKSAKKQQVKQFIFISTANTIGYGSLASLGNESQKIRSPFSQLNYAKTKLKAEEYVLKNAKNMAVKILNPTFMIGPYDSKPSSGKIILMSLGKKVVFYPPGGKNFVAVKDVVSAIINSFESGNTGDKYLIAGENLSYKHFFEQLRTQQNRKQFLIPVPKFILIALGFMGSTVRFFSIQTSLSLVNTRILCANNYYCNKKSKEQLKMQYSPIENALFEAVDYFNSKK